LVTGSTVAAVKWAQSKLTGITRVAAGADTGSSQDVANLYNLCLFLYYLLLRSYNYSDKCINCNQLRNIQQNKSKVQFMHHTIHVRNSYSDKLYIIENSHFHKNHHYKYIVRSECYKPRFQSSCWDRQGIVKNNRLRRN